jgi:hypothetical protein
VRKPVTSVVIGGCQCANRIACDAMAQIEPRLTIIAGPPTFGSTGSIA